MIVSMWQASIWRVVTLKFTFLHRASSRSCFCLTMPATLIGAAVPEVLGRWFTHKPGHGSRHQRTWRQLIHTCVPEFINYYQWVMKPPICCRTQRNFMLTVHAVTAWNWCSHLDYTYSTFSFVQHTKSCPKQVTCAGKEDNPSITENVVRV